MNTPAQSPTIQRAVIVALPPMGVSFATSPLATLADRPVIQHIIERLCAEGVRHVDVVGNEQDLELRHFACDSQRWGAHFRWRGAHNGNCDVLRRLGGEDRVLLAMTNALPLHSLSDLNLQQGIVTALRPGERIGRPTAPPERLRSDSPVWYAFAGEVFDEMPESTDVDGLREWLETLTEATVSSPRMLDVTTLNDLLSSQRQLLQAGQPIHEDDPAIRLIGRETKPGVRLCRNVKVHPSAEIVGPVFVGDNSRIGKHVRLGPNTVIGPNCIVDHHAKVSNSLVSEHSYLGPWIDVADCIVEQTHVTNVRLGAEVSIDDPLLLSHV